MHGRLSMQVDSTSYSDLKFLWLEITQHCNLTCRHCYTKSSPARPHNSIDWTALIADAHKLGCRQIQLIGGEPLTHPSFLDYLRLCRELSYEFIEVYSNLSLVTDEVCVEMRSAGANFAASFYSFDSAIHDEFTLTPGSHKATVEGIRMAVAYQIPIRIGMISMPGRPDHDKMTISYLEDLGIPRNMIRTDHVRPVGRGVKITPFKSQFETLCGACWSGKMAISFDGLCYPCVFSRDKVVGNVHLQKLAEIAGAEMLTSFRRDYRSQLKNTNTRREPTIEDCIPDCDPSAGPCDPNCMPKCTPPCDPEKL